VAWTQNGIAERYDVQVDGNSWQFVNVTGTASGFGVTNMTAIVYGLSVPGKSYCVNVTAVSNSRSSAVATVCGLITSKKLFVVFFSYFNQHSVQQYKQCRVEPPRADDAILEHCPSVAVWFAFDADQKSLIET
jgi:hypothetical protein